MKVKSLAPAVIALLSLGSEVQALSIQQKLMAFSKNLLSSSMVLMEEAIPAPHTLVEVEDKKHHDLVNTEVEEGMQADGQRRKFIDKKSTILTIVQDFPKKKTDENSHHSIEMVQGQSHNVNIE